MQGAAPSLLVSQFGVAYQAHGSTEFSHLRTRAAASGAFLSSALAAGSEAGAEDGGPPGGGALASHILLLVEAPVPSTDWQLSWKAPASDGEAGPVAVLRGLHINPGDLGTLGAARELGLPVSLPPPLVAPLTVVLTAEGASFAMLAPTPAPAGAAPAAAAGAPAVPELEPVASLHASGFRAAYHRWGCDAWAVDAAGSAGLQYLDSTTLSTVCLVEPFALDAAVESSDLPAAPAVGPAPGGSSPAGQEQRRQPSFWEMGWPSQDLAALAFRPMPQLPGTSVAVRAAAQPLVLNASELSLGQLRRASALLWGDAPAEPPGPPILLRNATGLELVVSQEGWIGPRTALPPGAELGYHWPAPPALARGAVRKLRLAWVLPAGGKAAEPVWSEPVEVRCRRGLLLGASFS